MKLSPQMMRMLEDVRDGLGTHGSAYGRSEHGGRYATAIALRRRGLLDFNNELTDAGRDVVRKDNPASQEAAEQTGGEHE
jgi:hypothetical protein